MPRRITEGLLAQGKTLRAGTPRSALGSGFKSDRDPIAILDAQNETRIPELVPIRWGRMSQSPFAFFRGTAALMAHDLARTPVSGVRVQACGDAHLSNFGFFASPERTLIFDLNDFDETAPAPWEWDVERLVASFAVVARSNGLGVDEQAEAARVAADSYRRAIRLAVNASALSGFHFAITADSLSARTAGSKRHRAERRAIIEHSVRKATKRTSERTLEKLATTGVGDDLRIVEQPPLVVRSELLPVDIEEVMKTYRETVSADIDMLMRRFRPIDLVRRVVGVGSVGTNALIMLLGDSGGNPLFLQGKEASASVLEPYAGPSGFTHMGQRVVAGQRIMQAFADQFLGWTVYGGRHYYVRQFRDMKGSFNVDGLSLPLLSDYATLCGEVLARAHVQSCEPAVLAGYLGKSDAFPDAMARFAVAYADQNDRDYRALVDAIGAGRLRADTSG